MNFEKHSLANLCFVVTLLAGLAAGSALAQNQEEPPFDRDDLLEGQIVTLTLHPTKQDAPALKHRLVLERSEMVDRNAVIYYLRAMLMDRDLRDSKDIDVDIADGWEAASELDPEKVKSWLRENRSVFRELQKASRCSHADWGLRPTVLDNTPWYGLDLNEIANTRRFVRMLAFKANYEIASKDYEEAIKTLRIAYQIGIDAAEAGYLVGDLVGIAEIGITNEVLLELIQQPDAPSLYWALVELPQPMVESRKTIREELLMMQMNTGAEVLKRPKEKRWSPREWRNQLFSDAENYFSEFGIDPPGVGIHGTATTIMLRGYPIAKQRLIESGMDPAKVEAMPVVQVVAIYEERVIEQQFEAFRKVMNLPFRQTIEAYERLEKSTAGFDGNKKGSSVIPTFESLFGTGRKTVMLADLRIRNRMVSLRTIEAIRLHLGETGELPESLGDIKVVPVPNNVWTGKPIFYKRTPEGATLFEFSHDDRHAKIYDLKVGETK